MITNEKCKDPTPSEWISTTFIRLWRRQTPFSRSVLLICWCLCGCATQNPPGTASHIRIRSSDLLSEPTPLSDVTLASTIIVKRDSGLSGSALTALFTVDGVDTAKIEASRYYQFQIDPGEHIFGVSSLKQGFILPTRIFREIAVDCKPGTTNFLRLYVDFGQGIQIQRSSR